MPPPKPASAGGTTRVSGGTPSAIDGTLRCTIPQANFYLINPAGVFGRIVPFLVMFAAVGAGYTVGASLWRWAF